MHVHVYVRTYVCTYVCMYGCTCVCMYVCTDTGCTCVCMYVCTDVHVYVCMYVWDRNETGLVGVEIEGSEGTQFINGILMNVSGYLSGG